MKGSSISRNPSSPGPSNRCTWLVIRQYAYTRISSALLSSRSELRRSRSQRFGGQAQRGFGAVRLRLTAPYAAQPAMRRMRKARRVPMSAANCTVRGPKGLVARPSVGSVRCGFALRHPTGCGHATAIPVHVAAAGLGVFGDSDNSCSTGEPLGTVPGFGERFKSEERTFLKCSPNAQAKAWIVRSIFSLRKRARWPVRTTVEASTRMA